MANAYYHPGSERGSRVQDLFTAIASRYDRINDIQSLGLHRWWKRRMIRLMQPGPGDRALDLCCGTGDLTFLLAKRGVAVVGLDFSGPMLEVAGRRAGPGPGEDSRIGFVRADGERLPFADASFTLVTVGYGLRNLSDWRLGLNEMWRVLRGGGRLAVLDFGKPTNQAWRAVYYGYLQCAVPWMGRIFCGNASAYGYILESLRHYPAQEGVHRHLRELGAEDCRVVNILGGAMSINLAQKPGTRTIDLKAQG